MNPTSSLRLALIALLYSALICVAGVYITGHGADGLRWVIDSFNYWMPR